MKKVLDTYWISDNRGLIGIVLTEDQYKQVAYIGICNGNSKDEDTEYIIKWGTKLTKNQAIGYFGNLVHELKYKR